MTVASENASLPRIGEQTSAWRALAVEAASRFGTPCYVSRLQPVLQTVESLERQFSGTAVTSWLSFKTHPVPHLAKAWIRTGRGVEVVSEAEFVTIRALGCPPAQLLVNGVAKHTWLHRHATADLRVHFDSIAEVDQLLPIALANRWHVGLRCHVPLERDAREPAFGGQFGMTADEVSDAANRLQDAGLRIDGMHFHLGQSARSDHSYVDSVRYVAELCGRSGVKPAYIDCGGGIDAGPDVQSSIDDLVRAVAYARRQMTSVTEVWLENGRYLTAASAALIVRVLDIKERPEGRYLICDGGRTNQALAADVHTNPLVAEPDRSGRSVLTTIAGPTCMTDDRLARVLLPTGIRRGDLILWMNAGAYHLPWETRFSQGLCAVVWGDADDALILARERETPQQWGTAWTTIE